MMTSDDLSSLQARLAVADHTIFLGRLVWYSVTSMTFDHGTLALALRKHGFGTSIPLPPSDVDVFRRVCTDAKRNRVQTDDAKIYCNYTVRDVGGDKKTLHRKIVRETVNTRDRKLSHETEMCDLIFDKAIGSVNVRCNGTDPVASAMAQKIETSYHAERGRLTSYVVREIIRHILLELGATNVRGKGGGLYFVREDHATKVEALEALAEEITVDDCVTVHDLPLIDDTKQRQMLRRAFESEAKDDVETLTNEIADLNQAGGKISSKVYLKYLDEYEKLRSKAEDYAELLEDNLSEARTQLRIFQRVIMDLNLSVDDGTDETPPSD